MASPGWNHSEHQGGKITKHQNGHEDPDDASSCQECGSKLQSAEEQLQELKARQDALRAEYTAPPRQPVVGSDVGRFFKKISPKQRLITSGAAVAIVVAIAVGVSVGGSGSAMDASKVEQKVIFSDTQHAQTATVDSSGEVTLRS